HLAVAMETPIIALFGPTDPKLTGPYGGQHRVIASSIKCRPCFKRKCYPAVCMKEITVEKVWEIARTILINKEEIYAIK
ncbi:MAG: glycosyltransferase family 9 protein, partial [Desulfobacterota bacterium]|nr:glycosyltransferase family 9 protein [Thermodesulfobacteriota bacterium]